MTNGKVTGVRSIELASCDDVRVTPKRGHCVR